MATHIATTLMSILCHLRTNIKCDSFTFHRHTHTHTNGNHRKLIGIGSICTLPATDLMCNRMWECYVKSFDLRLHLNCKHDESLPSRLNAWIATNWRWYIGTRSAFDDFMLCVCVRECMWVWGWKQFEWTEQVLQACRRHLHYILNWLRNPSR